MLKILVIDDQSAMRLLISKKIRIAFNAAITEADGVTTALKYLQSEEFDLVVCDYWMDDGNGSSVVEYVKNKTEINIPLILFSSDNEIVSSYLREGVHDAIVKPNFNDLISAIQNNTSMHKIQKRGI